MQAQTYILFFVFSCMIWVGLALLFAVGWYLFMQRINPTPKPTDWEAEWRKIENDLSQ